MATVRDYLLPEVAAAYEFTGVLDMGLEEFVAQYRAVHANPDFYTWWANLADRQAASAISAWQNIGGLIGLPVDEHGYTLPGPGWVSRLELESTQQPEPEPPAIVPANADVIVLVGPQGDRVEADLVSTVRNLVLEGYSVLRSDGTIAALTMAGSTLTKIDGVDVVEYSQARRAGIDPGVAAAAADNSWMWLAAGVGLLFLLGRRR